MFIATILSMNGPVRSVRSVGIFNPNPAMESAASPARCIPLQRAGQSLCRSQTILPASSGISTTSARIMVNICSCYSRSKANAASNSMDGRPLLRLATAFWSIHRAPRSSTLAEGSLITYPCTCRGRSSFLIGRPEWGFRDAWKPTIRCHRSCEA